LREGLFLRVLLLAPYRCKKCRIRFFRFSPWAAARRRKKHKSLAGYLGLHDSQARRFQRTVRIVLLFILLSLIALYLVYYFSTTSSPPPVQ
jgi:hypothetical protein